MVVIKFSRIKSGANIGQRVGGSSDVDAARLLIHVLRIIIEPHHRTSS